jgi:hypothetical protein
MVDRALNKGEIATRIRVLPGKCNEESVVSSLEYRFEEIRRRMISEMIKINNKFLNLY